MELAYEVAEDFGINISEARKTAKHIAKATKDWKKQALQYGANRQEIDFMSSAFEHDDVTNALKN